MLYRMNVEFISYLNDTLNGFNNLVNENNFLEKQLNILYNLKFNNLDVEQSSNKERCLKFNNMNVNQSSNIEHRYSHSLNKTIYFKKVIKGKELLTKGNKVSSVKFTNNLLNEKLLSKFIKKNYSIKCLNINNYYNLNLSKLINCLFANKRIKELSLQNNGLDDKQSIYISNILENNNTLEKLDLSYNNFTDIGICRILNSIIDNNESAINKFTFINDYYSIELEEKNNQKFKETLIKYYENYTNLIICNQL